MVRFVSTLGTDNGQRDMVPHFGGSLGNEKIVARSFEEFQSRAIFKRRRVCDIDDDSGA